MQNPLEILEFKVKPWDHQAKGIRLAAPLDEFALFFEQGTGKTATAIHILRYRMMLAQQFLKTIVFCPPIVIPNWNLEFTKNSVIEEKRIVPLVGTGKQRLAAFKKAEEKFLGEAIYITNYESLQIKELYQAFLQAGFQALIGDESQKFKNPQGKRTKLLAELAAPIKYKLILSGTPILRSPMDIFSQFLVLDGGKTFGQSFWSFRSKYFYDKNAGMNKFKHFPNWVPQPGAYEDLKEKISKKSLRVEKKDCLDLPPLVKQTISVGMTSEQQEHYDNMKRDFITYIGEKECMATLALTKALRLQQIASGFISVKPEVITDEFAPDIIPFEESPRDIALKELLEEIAPYHKVIVWAVWRPNYVAIAKICKELKLPFVQLHGGQSVRENQEAISQFKHDESIRVIIANPQAGGVGVNLQESSYAIFYSRNFSLENDLQAEARNYRGGSEMHEKVTRIDLIATDTIDEVIAGALSHKKSVSDAILNMK